MRPTRVYVLGTILAVLACLAATGPALAADAKSELTLSGALTKPADGATVWSASGELGAALGHSILLGPAAVVASDSEKSAAGAVLEWNFAGKAVGPFIGGQGLYFLKDQEGLDRQAVAARAGFKIPVGSSGLVKVYAQKAVNGRGKSDDLAVVLGAGLRF